MVELVGIEPTTSSLRTMASSVLMFLIFPDLVAFSITFSAVYWTSNGTAFGTDFFANRDSFTSARRCASGTTWA